MEILWENDENTVLLAKNQEYFKQIYEKILFFDEI